MITRPAPSLLAVRGRPARARSVQGWPRKPPRIMIPFRRSKRIKTKGTKTNTTGFEANGSLLHNRILHSSSKVLYTVRKESAFRTQVSWIFFKLDIQNLVFWVWLAMFGSTGRAIMSTGMHGTHLTGHKVRMKLLFKRQKHRGGGRRSSLNKIEPTWFRKGSLMSGCGTRHL